MALLKQDFDFEESNGRITKISLRNTIDCSMAIDSARAANESGNGGRFGDRNSEKQLMGYIPDEMWLFDPWLILANRAKNEGNKLEYQKYLQKFFDVHPMFKVHRNTKYWRGDRAVLL